MKTLMVVLSLLVTWSVAGVKSQRHFGPPPIEETRTLEEDFRSRIPSKPKAIEPQDFDESSAPIGLPFFNGSIISKFFKGTTTAKPSTFSRYSSGTTFDRSSNGSTFDNFSNGPVIGRFSNGPPIGRSSNGSTFDNFSNGPPIGRFSNGPILGRFSNGSTFDEFSNGPPIGRFSSGSVLEKFKKPKVEVCSCESLNASKVIQGAKFDVSQGASVNTHCGFPVAASLKNGNFIGFFNVDFAQGYKLIHLRFSNGSPDSKIPFIARFHLDSPYGDSFATVTTQPKGGWCDFVELRVFVSTIPTNYHNLYITSAVDPNSKVGVFNLQWFYFTNDVFN